MGGGEQDNAPPFLSLAHRTASCLGNRVSFGLDIEQVVGAGFDDPERPPLVLIGQSRCHA